MIRLHDVEQGSEEWHALREGLYTGNGADKLLKFGTIDYALSHTNGFKGTFWTERGHLLETQAISIYGRIRGITVPSMGFVTNDKYPDCGYSPDGWPGDALPEVKSFDEEHHMQLIRAKTINDIPFKILAQVYFGLFITELPVAHLMPYNPKMKKVEDRFKIIEIRPKRSITANFRRILR